MLNDELATLFNRDLGRLIDNIEEIPAEHFWRPLPGITNSCGVLAQHLLGNLNHFVGAVLGKTGYVREREMEFTPEVYSRDKLIKELKELKETVSETLNGLGAGEWDAEFPAPTPYETTTRGFVIHLYGHLNYHLGQLNYLQRILREKPEN